VLPSSSILGGLHVMDRSDIDRMTGIGLATRQALQRSQ